MSQYNIIRPATEEDTTRLEAAAQRFIRNHGFDPREYAPGDVFYQGDTRREVTHEDLRTWRKALRRALRSPKADGIGWGNVLQTVR